MRPKDVERNLSHERLTSILDYDPSSGVFRWKALPHPNASNIKIGDVAGSQGRPGSAYIRVTISGERYLAHRLAWFYVYKMWPESRVDHRNLCKNDNRIENLRAASDSENSANSKVNRSNALGVKGVRLHEGGKYVARICVNGNPKYLGLFERIEDASSAYAAAARELFGEFARHT